eukprot:g2814.t1
MSLSAGGNLLYATVVRGWRTILCSGSSNKNSHDEDTFQRNVVKLLPLIEERCQRELGKTRFGFEAGGKKYSVLREIDSSVAFLCVSDSNVPLRIVFKFLDKLRDKITGQDESNNSSESLRSPLLLEHQLTAEQLRPIEKELPEMLQFWSENDRLRKAIHFTEEVKDQMILNIELMLEREEEVEELLERAENVSEGAQSFQRQTVRLESAKEEDSGIRLEKFLKKYFRGVPVFGFASTMSNKQFKNSVKLGEVYRNGEVCLDKARKLCVGDVIEMRRDFARDEATKKSNVIDVRYEKDDVVILFKEPGISTRTIEKSLDKDLILLYGLSKQSSGLLVASKNDKIAELQKVVSIRWRVLVYGQIDTKDKIIRTEEILHNIVPPTNDDDDEKFVAFRKEMNSLGKSISIRTVNITRCRSSGHLTLLDLYCPGMASGRKLNNLLFSYFESRGYPVVGDERAEHAWVRKKGIYISLVGVSLKKQMNYHDDKDEIVTIEMPSKFNHTTKRESSFALKEDEMKLLTVRKRDSPSINNFNEMKKKQKTINPKVQLSTTLGLANRIENLKTVQNDLQIDGEKKSDLKLYERDNQTIEIASGWERLLLGDHGPYFECHPNQVNFEAFGNGYEREKYVEYFSKSLSTKLYLQKETVKDRPNPPKDGRWWVCNNRSEGYADYCVGFCYISVDDVCVNGRVMNLTKQELFERKRIHRQRFLKYFH